MQPMKTLGSWPMTSLRGLWLGGAARPVACAGDEYASVGPITAGWKPVAPAAGPMTEGAQRRMSQSSLSACLTVDDPGSTPHVADQNNPQRLEGKGLQVSCKPSTIIPSVRKHWGLSS